MSSDGSPAGPVQAWLTIPHMSVASDSLEVSRTGDRFLVTLVQRASDLWLVERAR